MKNIYRWYFKRLWSAILGKEYREAYYQYALKDFILELVVEFIDSNRCSYPIGYSEESWERKLRSVKKSIQNLQKLEEKWWDIENETVQEYWQKYNKLQKRVLKWITDIFPDLWD